MSYKRKKKDMIPIIQTSNYLLSVYGLETNTIQKVLNKYLIICKEYESL